MKKRVITVALCLCLGFLLVTQLAACSVLSSSEDGDFSFNGEPKYTDPEYVRKPPAVVMSGYSGENQQAKEEDGKTAVIDLTNVSKGYVTAQCIAPVRAKFRVECASAGGSEKIDFDIDNTGVYDVFPLSLGDGYYTFSVYTNISGDEYMNFLTAEADVVLENEFAPFLVPNKIVNYTPQSDVVSFSWTLAEHAQSDLEVVQQVYYWIENNIAYDTDKANAVRNASGYLPDVDRTLAEKKGICYDYAALVASMLRANGIPCQLVVGDVSVEGGTVYHAWNMIWLEDEGWVAVKVPSTPEEWQRLDLTFASSKDPNIAQFIGDGQNYVSMFVY